MRTFGLIASVAVYLAFTSVLAVGVYGLVRSLATGDAQRALGLVSAVSGFIGVSALLGPFVGGLAVARSHDLTRLASFPVSWTTLALASFLANTVQPAVLGQLPIFLALSLATARAPGSLVLTASGFALTYASFLAASQIGSLASLFVARSRRLRDGALFASVLGGLAMSALPFVLLTQRGLAGRVFSALGGSGIVRAVPFSYGAQAAIHGGGGDLSGFAALAVAATAAVAGGIAVAAFLVRQIHTGEVDLGSAPAGRAVRRFLNLPGATGALLEKDLRSAWRDPSVRAGLATALLGPLMLVWLVATQGRTDGRGSAVFFMALLVGATGPAASALGSERRAIAQLLTFPVPRHKILVAKNFASAVFKVPGLVMVALAALVFASFATLPAALVVFASAFLMACGLDNYVSIHSPVTAAAPGADPRTGAAASGRGLLGLAATLGALFLAAPFAFLAWLPGLLDRPMLAFACLPLALAGAVATYALLIGGAERLLLRREDAVLETILGDVRGAA